MSRPPVRPSALLIEPPAQPNVAARLSELRDLLRLVASGRDLHATLAHIAHWIEAASPGALCSVLLLDETGKHVVNGASPSLPVDYVRAIDGAPVGPKAGSCGTAAYRGAPVVVTDIATDPLWEDYRAIALPFGLRACWSHPIFAPAGEVIGTFAIYHLTPGAPSDEEWALVVDAASVAAMVIDRARMDARRAAQEHALATILEHAHDPIVRMGVDRRYTFANPAMARIMGRPAADIVGRTREELGYSAEIVRRAESILQQVIETDAPVRTEYFLASTVGERWYESVTTAELDGHGQVVSFLTIARDITDRRRAEQALKTNEIRLRTIFNSTNRLIALLDPSGRFIDVGERAMRATNLTREQLVGQPFWEMPTLDGLDDSRATLRASIETAASGTPGEGEIRFRLADGTIRLCHYTSQPIRDANGEVVQLLLEGSDVTERRGLEERVRQSEKMESLGRLAGGIAHDFNNVLAAIMGNSEMLVTDLAPDSEAFASVSEILTASRRARDLVKQILAFSRKADIVHLPTDVRRVVIDAMRLLRASFPATIELRDQITESPLVVMGDASQLSQVFLNLGTNAEYAMRVAGHGTLDVELQRLVLDATEARTQNLGAGAFARLVVRDSGAGIPADVLPKIFEPFFTTKPVGEGTGMGLAVVHGIVTAHGGSVRVMSQSGKGTTFEILLPCVSVAATEPTPVAPVLAFGHGRILVVDDEDAIVDMLRRVLPRRGYQSVCLNSPVEALELFCRDPDAFDVVLTDRTMPHLTGDALARAIHAVRPRMPVVLCSGQGHSDADHDVEVPWIVHLAKPFDAADLAGAIARARELAESGTGNR